MEKYLVFRLYGPMVAWGEIAVGEVRGTASYPGRSAILGLISAASGIRRDETEKSSRLIAGYDVAVKLASSGTILKDFHTVQAPQNKSKKILSTRYDEIVNSKELNTMLTSREYRCDALTIVALRERTDPLYSLEELMMYLKKPEFVLYLGRKSCPLAAPLKPQIISAQGFRFALDNTEFPPLVVSYDNNDITGRFIPRQQAQYYWEGEAGDMEPQQVHERFDEPVNRMRWQFAARQENYFFANGGD